MSRTVGQVVIQYVSTADAECKRPCCARYTMNILGREIEISQDDAREILRQMRGDSDPYAWEDRNMFVRSPKLITLDLVLR